MADDRRPLSVTTGWLLFAVYGLLLSACSAFVSMLLSERPFDYPTTRPFDQPTKTPTPVRYAVIGKARGGYWDSVEHGALAAERQLGLPSGSVIYTAPEDEDPAAQIVALENF